MSPGLDFLLIIGAKLSIMFLPFGEGTATCAEGNLLIRDGSLNTANNATGSCTVTVTEWGLRVRGTFTAQTRNPTGTADGPVLTGSFDLANPVPPSGLLRATVDGTVYETDRPTVLQVSTVISVSVGVPSYGLTAALLVNLNANNVVTGVFDCADLLSGTSVAISPSPVLTSTAAMSPSCQIEVTAISDGFINGTFTATLGNGTDPDVAVTDGSFRFAAP